jgi:hypothetical protein
MAQDKLFEVISSAQWGDFFILREERDAWACENYHFNPDTGAEFMNGGDRRECEICGRPRPTDDS